MKLNIETIADRGVPNQERLHLKVLETTNLSFYVVLSSYLVGDKVANGTAAAFWFPSIDVKPGDQVVLYSRSGAPIIPTANAFLPLTYFFFWGLENTIWSGPDSCAVLFDAQEWKTSPRAAAAIAPSAPLPILRKP